MTTAMTPIQAAHLATFTPDQRDLIKRTVAPDATNDELAMFLHVAAKSGLDPLQKQIWFVKRKANVGTRENPKWEDRVTIQAGIDGLQARAARESDYEGMLYGVVCQKDAFAFDATAGLVKEHTYNPFADRGQILGAWCVVRRQGLLPFTAMVRYSEYYDERSFLWKNKPAVMIEKVARSTALRRAFPEQFSAIYEDAEMPETVRQEPQPIPSRKAEAKRLEAPAPIGEVIDALPVETPPPTQVPAAEPELSLEEQPYARLWARASAAFKRNAMPKFIWACTKVGIPKDLPPDAWTMAQAEEVAAILFPDDRGPNP